MGLTRLEVNLRRLLVKCELLIKNKQKDDPRIPKYISSLHEMIISLQETTESDSINEYYRRLEMLKSNFPEQFQSKTPVKSKTNEIYPEELPENTKLSPREELLGTNLRQRNTTKGDDLDELLEYHQNMQEKISKDMLQLTRNLKDQTVLANKIIKADTEVVSKSSHLAEKNFSKLKVESEKLTEHSKRACKCWMWVMLIIVMVLFINMVLFMKVMKKRV